VRLDLVDGQGRLLPHASDLFEQFFLGLHLLCSAADQVLQSDVGGFPCDLFDQFLFEAQRLVQFVFPLFVLNLQYFQGILVAEQVADIVEVDEGLVDFFLEVGAELAEISHDRKLLAEGEDC
jgi:hypothetical protein